MKIWSLADSILAITSALSKRKRIIVLRHELMNIA
jgi:hypothetical protein